jgi:acyl carrier protein
MDRSTVKQRLDAVFQDIFDDPSLHVTDAMTANDVEGWDSLSHIDLIVAVEKEFRIRLTTAEVRSLHNVGDFMTLLASKAA